MKIKTLSRSEQQHTRANKGDVTKVHRNATGNVNKFQRAREYQRALVAVKLDKMFAKPFVGALDGHMDGVWCTANCKRSLVEFISGSCDGEIKAWDLAQRRCVWTRPAHDGFVRGISIEPHNAFFLSCGDDCTIKKWRLQVDDSSEDAMQPDYTWSGDRPFLSLDHHWAQSKFCTSAEAVDVWDYNRPQPVSSFAWGADAVTMARWNPAEPALIASAGADRSVTLYDVRQSNMLHKTTLAMKSNCLAWNPQEPFNFVVANEDHNLYTFDMRRMESALKIHKDHVSAVMSVAFSPTGQEFVTGSYDRTVRIFGHRAGRSKECYHARRMQRVFCVNYSADARFVISGSDDTNLRIWKADANESLGPRASREIRSREYRDALKNKFAHMPEIRKIAKRRHTPKAIHKATVQERESNERQRRKTENRIKHSRPGTVKREAQRQQVVVKKHD
uniref:Sof1-like protein domain-containing protein n=1 Tax=Phaeomonas parva TaxID=124430 RepID=A0A7S1XXE0_9STRA|mmetsp:Transcript_42361/g.132832  ORF Transcript_42361/g.132832 Transcript_42361/m.132832 type:complete len:447 (+) Transcript_42361:169-1509(+)